MKAPVLVLRSTIIAALGGLLFGFDTAVISGTTSALEQVFVWLVLPETRGISLESIQKQLGID